MKPLQIVPNGEMAISEMAIKPKPLKIKRFQFSFKYPNQSV